MQKVTAADVAEGLTEFWSQQVIGSANGNLFKVAKGIGSTTWHTHEDQEETFLILHGELTIQLRSGRAMQPPTGAEHGARSSQHRSGREVRPAGGYRSRARPTDGIGVP